MTAAPLLALRGASTHVPGQVFGPFDLAVTCGERIAILGPSGAGKSTLLKLMAGERPLHGGSVELIGSALAAWPPAALALQRAVLPQAHGVAFALPVDLVVALGRFARDHDPQQPAIVAAALQAAQAAHLAGRRFDTLSGGEQARVQLARVLAQLWDCEGGLLLVDEPLASLDPGLQLALLAALETFAAQRRHTLVAVLHDMQQALTHFQRLWLVQGGRVVGDLRADRAALPALERLFGVALHGIDTAQGLALVVRRAAGPAAHAAAQQPAWAP